MATTLSHGFIKPQDGDKGSVFWSALEDNIQQLNDHTHDGTDSEKLTALSSEAVVDDVASGDWVSSGTMFRQLVTVPSGMDVDEMNVIFRNASGGAQLFWTRKKCPTRPTTFTSTITPLV